MYDISDMRKHYIILLIDSKGPPYKWKRRRRWYAIFS